MRKPGAKTGPALDIEMHAHTCTGVCTDTHAHNEHSHWVHRQGRGAGGNVHSEGVGWVSSQGPRSWLSQVQAESMALPGVTQQGGQPETHTMDLVLPSLGQLGPNQASSGPGCPLVFLLSTSLFYLRLLLFEPPGSSVWAYRGKRGDGWKRFLTGLNNLHYPIRQPLPIGSY